MAALQGQSLKDFMLQRTLGQKTTVSVRNASMGELLALLDACINRAGKEDGSTRTAKPSDSS